MQFYDPLTNWLSMVAGNFRDPEYLWAIPILIVLILWLVRRNFVTYGYDEDGFRKLKRRRWMVFFMRSLAVTLLLVALATPFTTISKETEGNPRAVVLIDDSGSMDAYDTSFTDFLVDELSGELPTTVKHFGTKSQSPVGDAALSHSEHLLLISDGNANTGVALEDVAQVARQQNRTISAISLNPLRHDSAVVISAPNDIPLGFPAQIRVEVTSTNEDPIPLTVSVDGRQVHSGLTRDAIELNPELTAGYHTIEARITKDDSDPGNNVHYHVIQVLDKPKVLILSDERGQLEQGLSQIFDATISRSLPSDLSQYYSIVINDMPASQIAQPDRIADFLRDDQGDKYGNGMVVIGGFDSFDRGGYKNSQFESLLPVKVGRPKRELGDNSLVFVIQVSGSTSGTRYVQEGGQLREVRDETPVVDIIKAQAVNAIESLNLENKVGVIMFGASTAGESYGSAQEAIEASVVKVADIEPLYSHRKEIIDRVSSVQGGGTTAPKQALQAAVNMLKDRSGSRTIIFLTNGRFSAGLGDVDAGAKSDVESTIANAARLYGIQTHVIGVGSTEFNEEEFKKRVDEEFLVSMARRSDGLYDRATNMARLILEYGDPNEKGFGDQFRLVTLSLTHFITRDLELSAVMNGFNEVAPKDGSRILVKTDGGQPALTTWNYFNGRVAALTVFTGSGLGPLLEGDNSDLIRNTVLWSIGDPRRKEPVTVEVGRAIVGQTTEVTFTSESPISGNCEDTQIQFDRSLGNQYVFTFTPSTTGIKSVCGIPYAVNNPSENWRVGFSESLLQAVQISGGQVFEFDQTEEIVEQIKIASTRVQIQKTEVRNPFIALALIIFLLEIFIRRLTQRKR